MNTDHSRQPELELCSRGSRRWRPSLQALPATSAPAGPGQQPGSRVNPTSCERAVLLHVLFLFQDLIPTLGRAVLSPHTASSPPTQQGSRPNLLLQRGPFLSAGGLLCKAGRLHTVQLCPLNSIRKGREGQPLLPGELPQRLCPCPFWKEGQAFMFPAHGTYALMFPNPT